MGINLYNIKRWTKMIFGKSIFHVDQGLGRVISKGGYYNDLTQKVLLGEKTLNHRGIPELILDNGSRVEMPTMIFQYGLGAYDLWLMTNDSKYLRKATICADWALEHITGDGAWDNFSYIFPDQPYSAMSQGEGISLLVRIYETKKDARYLTIAKAAAAFMVRSVDEGGTTYIDKGQVTFLEYTHRAIVLNGWVFALFGIYDILKYCEDDYYKNLYSNSLQTLQDCLPKYDLKYWSIYASDGKISSPFYHKLHIALMSALYLNTSNPIFEEYANKWQRDYNNVMNRSRAFIIKSYQKIVEKN